MKGKRKTDAEYRMQLKETHPDIEALTFYTGALNKIKFRHSCGYTWWARADSILRLKFGCPKCATKTIHDLKKMTLDELIRRIKILFNDTIEYVTGFVNYRTKCLFRCKKCQHEWWTTPSTILRTLGCPVCLKKSLEKPVLEILKKKGIKYSHNISLEGSNYKGSKIPLRIDFIIETSKGKLAIETDGVHHFNPFYGKEDTLKLQQEHDRYKDKLLKEKGYILIRVTSSPTKEWGFKNHIILAELLHLIEIGIDSETGEINFELFRKYDFNRD